ncbi:hypothetical protein ACP70R_024206 [Stipagrostis hirtigluma subsp. patula]
MSVIASAGGATSIAARSLNGLVAFLTSYSRYLRTREAMRYLRLSRADLLVAVHLVEENRAAHAFAADHPIAEMALTCAAVSPAHPQPAAFVSTSPGFPHGRGLRLPRDTAPPPQPHREEPLRDTHGRRAARSRPAGADAPRRRKDPPRHQDGAGAP